MFENFIEDLCKNENLIDVARLGKASQSSLSKWSKEDDAQRAVSGNIYEDYAFHTDKEKNAWWQVSFESEISPYYIIISNRRNEVFIEKAAAITISCISEDNEVVVIHQGLLYFGSPPLRIPLILPLEGRIKVKKILISTDNAKPEYLHLNQVNVLCKKALMIDNPDATIFFSNRIDGFGMRLSGIMAAMIYAHRYEGRFLFSWFNRNNETYNNYHITNDVESVFSDDFIGSHVIDKSYIDKLKLLNAHNYNKQSDNATIDGYICGYENRNDFIKSKSQYNFREAFDSIGFSQKLLRIKRIAESVNIRKKSVAIHIRTGDIVYDKYRLFHSFHYKATPAHVIIPLIIKYKNEGYDVILFGQEAELCTYLSEKYSIVYSKKYSESVFDSTELAFFDITLMSRVSLIISAGSAFSKVASLIGDSEVIEYNKVLSDKDIIDGFYDFQKNEDFLREKVLSDLYISFTYINFFRKYKDKLTTSVKLAIIDKCILLEPDNYLNKLIRSIVLLNTDSFAAANKSILKMIESPRSGEFLKSFIQKKESLPPVDYVFKEHIKDFVQLAEQGYPSVAIILLMHENYSKSSIDLSFYHLIVEKARTAGYEGVELLESELQIAKTTIKNF